MLDDLWEVYNVKYAKGNERTRADSLLLDTGHAPLITRCFARYGSSGFVWRMGVPSPVTGFLEREGA